MKRILTIQDISCFGKCSLTVALPILSALGSETVILPTAVLSTHTMFPNFTLKDLDDQIEPIFNHWQSLNILFSTGYSGYLASSGQIQKVKTIFETLKKEQQATIVVDPAMADHGKFYTGFNQTFADEMQSLCAVADVIVPNLTEAAFLTRTPYLENYTKQNIEHLLKLLAQIGPDLVVLTGIEFEPHKTGVYAYQQSTDTYYYYETDKVDVALHGTGDLFASVFTGELTADGDWQKAIRHAANFALMCVQETLTLQQKHPEQKLQYGVHFESHLPNLMAMHYNNTKLAKKKEEN